jgi:hypothetical protein
MVGWAVTVDRRLADPGERMSEFMGYFQTNVAHEVGRLGAPSFH